MCDHLVSHAAALYDLVGFGDSSDNLLELLRPEERLVILRWRASYWEHGVDGFLGEGGDT